MVVGGVAVGTKGMAKDRDTFNNLQGRISSLQVKKRVQRKKKKIQEDSEEVRQLFVLYFNSSLSFIFYTHILKFFFFYTISEPAKGNKKPYEKKIAIVGSLKMKV